MFGSSNRDALCYSSMGFFMLIDLIGFFYDLIGVFCHQILYETTDPSSIHSPDLKSFLPLPSFHAYMEESATIHPETKSQIDRIF